jgi:hypothetical protein
VIILRSDLKTVELVHIGVREFVKAHEDETVTVL